MTQKLLLIEFALVVQIFTKTNFIVKIPRKFGYTDREANRHRNMGKEPLGGPKWGAYWDDPNCILKDPWYRKIPEEGDQKKPQKAKEIIYFYSRKKNLR